MIDIKNKASIWVVQTLDKIRKHLPFELKGVSVDKGTEFINAHLNT